MFFCFLAVLGTKKQSQTKPILLKAKVKSEKEKLEQIQSFSGGYLKKQTQFLKGQIGVKHCLKSI